MNSILFVIATLCQVNGGGSKITSHTERVQIECHQYYAQCMMKNSKTEATNDRLVLKCMNERIKK